MKLLQDVTWSVLGTIGRSSISKLSILMPFIGYLILLQEKFVGLATPLVFRDGSDFKVSIGFYLLYFGLFIFGLGSFIFHIASPETAKSFKSADDYVERLQTLVTPSELLSKLEFILSKSEINSAISREALLYKNAISVGINAQPQQSIKAFVLRSFFDLRDRSRFSLRVTVFVLFSLGIILAMIPSFIALLNVWVDFSKNYL
ncbi:hypothetical protein [Rhizobium multihospitium]|uniref:Uncharacterized protein n=1 Tax=Rhizobium multihospitium TaxID=410764 RepID=A0A1C3VRL3_9HYPH|nr:hypothetical protein [Rhizobium multihospitium]SCB30338.1 hypothetical protein GA0061103_4258 [Rhizobium multihospitium]